jgi:hypothetical protein
MKKVTVIIGEANTGKTLTAMMIAEKKGIKTTRLHVANMKRAYNKCFFFNPCDIDTKMIIIDEIRAGEFLKEFIMLFQQEIPVEKQGKEMFFINPEEVILVCSESITKEEIERFPASLKRRIELIECTKETLEKQLESLK